MGDVISNDFAKAIGNHPDTEKSILVCSRRFRLFVQMCVVSTGKVKKGDPKPKRASVPKEKDPASVTLEEATNYLALPRVLGKHPVSGEDITASIGRFGPFVVHQKDFRSLKTDSP